MWNYNKRMMAEASRWRDAGWISPDGEAAIRADLAGRKSGVGLAASLSILAAILIGFAVMSFVAANWQDMPRVFRLGLLLGLLWAAYGTAVYLFSRGAGSFAHACVLLGSAVFGASIMLISQMYHMDGSPPDAVLVWALGALFAGVMFRSNPALAFAIVLMSVWGTWEAGRREEVFWPFVLGWAAVSSAFVWQRWRPGVHLSGLSLTGFVVSLGYLLDGGHAHHLVVIVGVVFAGLVIVGETTRPELSDLFSPMLGYAIVTTFCGLFALQFIEPMRTADGTMDSARLEFMVLAAVTLVLMLAAVWWGMSHHSRGALWLGYIGFSIEILGIYQKTVGTLLGTSLFFLIAGLIVAALAYMAYRLHSRGERAGVVS